MGINYDKDSVPGKIYSSLAEALPIDEKRNRKVDFMDIKRMLEELEPKESDAEMMVANLRNQFIELYNEKSAEKYAAVLKDMLHIAIQLKNDLILKHFGATPVVVADETMQLQEMFKCLALRNRNPNWFLDLFALYMGLAVVLRLQSADIEHCFFNG